MYMMVMRKFLFELDGTRVIGLECIITSLCLYFELRNYKETL